MEYEMYAVAEETKFLPKQHIFDGQTFFPSDLVLSNDGRYYRMFELSIDKQSLLSDLLEKCTIIAVEKILDAKSGEIQWTTIL